MPKASLLLRHQIIRGPHLSIRSGGAYFHLSARKLMEEKRRAPVVHKLPLAIDAKAGFFGDKFRAVGIIAVQGAGYVHVQTDGVAAVARAVTGDDVAHVAKHDRGLHWRRSVSGTE